MTTTADASRDSQTSRRLAFLGLGAMGQRMAARLLGAGHAVTVWNRSPGPQAALQAQGARVGATPREAAEGADVVFAMLRDDAASLAVWLDDTTGAAAALAPDALAVECSTLSPAWVAELARQLPVPLVDAPVAGSRPQAEAGQLIFMAGGAAADVERLRPLLLAMGSVVHTPGSTGSGAALKLAVNSLFATQVAAVAEQLALLRSLDVDLPTALAVLKAMPVTSPAAAGAAALMLAGADAPQFPVELVVKDLGYAVAASAQPLPLTASTLGRFQAALEAGYGNEHLVAVRKLYA
jgi:3-hydroxyisobutyrate dehydrogenase